MMSVDKPKVVKLIILFLFALCVGLCVSAFCTANQCLLEPCYSEIGVDQLYKVDGGESLELVMLSLICFVHVMIAHFILFKAPFDQTKYGMLLAGTAMLGMLMFLQAVLYGQESTLMNQLSLHLNGGVIHDMNFAPCNVYKNSTTCNVAVPCHWMNGQAGVCERNMGINTSAKSKFQATCAFSMLVSITHVVFAFVLWTWKEDFGSTYGNEVQAPTNLATPPAFGGTDDDIRHSQQI